MAAIVPKTQIPHQRTAPAPAAVPVDRSPLPVAQGQPSFWAQMKGKWVNITAMVEYAIFGYGFRRPTRSGVADLANGTLFLTDVEGRWSIQNPHAEIDPMPGVPVEIYASTDRYGLLLFKGISEGVATRDYGEPQKPLPAINLAGSLRRLESFGSGYWEYLSGQAYPAQVIAKILDAMQFDGIRRLSDNGRIEVVADMINRSTILSQGAGRTTPLQGLNEIVLAEAGKLWDGPQGEIVYNTFWDRDGENPTAIGQVRSVVNPIGVRLHDPRAYVVNKASSKQGDWESIPQRAIPFYRYTEASQEADLAFPFQIPVPAYTREHKSFALTRINWGGIPAGLAADFGQAVGAAASAILGSEVEITDPAFFVNQWHLPDNFISYPYRYSVEQRGSGLILHFENPTGAPVNALIQQPEGQIVKRVNDANVYAQRSDESIRRYGPRNFLMPQELSSLEPTARALTDQVVDAWDGVTEDGRFVPPIGAVITIKDVLDSTNDPRGAFRWDVNDTLLLTWETPFKTHCQEWPFWVEGVDYKWERGGTLDAEIHCLDAYRGGPVAERPAGRERLPEPDVFSYLRIVTTPQDTFSTVPIVVAPEVV